MEQIILLISALIWFFIGYYIGSGKKPQDIKEEIKKQIWKKTPVGPVIRPSSEKVNQWNDKKRLEEDEAFKEEFLKSHPELKTVYERKIS